MSKQDFEPVPPETISSFSCAAEDGAICADNLPTFFPALKQQLHHRLAYQTGDPHLWQRQARPEAARLMLPGLDNPDMLLSGAVDAQEAEAFSPTLLDEIDRGAFMARRVRFTLRPGCAVVALILVPKGAGPFPGIMWLHDHGARFDIGKEKGMRPWYDEAKLAASQAWAERYFSGLFPAEELARRGYMVFAIDALGWGDRQGNGYEAQQALACNLLNIGHSLAGMVAEDDLLSLRFIQTQPELDASRIAAVGFSFGAFRAWQLAALSPHVKAAVAICWMGACRELMVPGNNQLRGQSAWYMTHPGLVRLLDYPDVAALAAPKPLYFIAGKEDALFPLPAVELAYEKLQGVWRAFGAQARLKTEICAGGHHFDQVRQEAVFTWLAARL